MAADDLSPADEARLAIAEGATDHVFSDRSLLRLALTHPSVNDDILKGRSSARKRATSTGAGGADAAQQGEERVAEAHYERLEFLGDAFISLVVTEELYERFPDLREGDLTKLKTGAVSGPSLSEAASELGLADALFLGESVRGAGGRGLSSALENGFEALVAALYLDAGFEVARAFVSRTLGAHIGEHAAVPAHPKSELQELLQMRGNVPTYRLVSEEGPPHDRTFTVLVELDGRELGRGIGRSKKKAEMRAAAAAIEHLAGSDAEL